MHASANDDEVVRHYSNSDLTVVWRPARCIHSRRCWKELPSVFDPKKRPWVTITGASSAEIAAQVRRCPSGALSLLDDSPAPVSAPVEATSVSPVHATAPVQDRQTITRDLLIHRLHEAAELEHSLMCCYLYAAWSLKQDESEGLSKAEAEATQRWRSAIVDVAVQEMGHLAAVWNITSALGGSPRFGRTNFPSDPGLLPASVVAKLAPFAEATIQHFIYLERPHDSQEPDHPMFEPEVRFVRGATRDGLTAMSFDYATVGELYATIESNLRSFVASHGEETTFVGEPELQLSQEEVALDCVAPVTSLSSALATLDAIIEQGEGSPVYSERSHFASFVQIRAELQAMRALNPAFEPAHAVATNPVLRRPPRAADRMWVEDEAAARTVDLANACYGLMLRLLAYAYVLPRGAEKKLAVNLSIELMGALALLGERAARLPVGPAHPEHNAGVSFTTLRDTAPLPPCIAARFYFMERFQELAAVAQRLDASEPRAAAAARIATRLAEKANRELAAFT